MQTIASQVGVSKATVSRALRNLPGLSEPVRSRILDTARKLGYVKHPLISAMMSDVRFKKTSTFSPVVALLHCMPWEKAENLHLNIKLLRDKAKEHASNLGYSVEEFYLNEPGMTPKRMLDIIKARGIRGIIFEHFFESDVRLEIDLSEFASVAIGFTLKSPNLHRVVVDQYNGLLLAIEKLKSLGYKRMGVVIPGLNETFTNFKREAALHVAHQATPQSDRVPMLIYSVDVDEKTLRNWLQDHEPDVILSIHNEIPTRIKALGFRIPEDIGFVHLGWHKSYMDWAGIAPNWDQVGIAATNQVVDQLNRNEFGVPEKPLTTLIEGTWMDGPSIPRRK